VFRRRSSRIVEAFPIATVAESLIPRNGKHGRLASIIVRRVTASSA
jgi:hypothetical protein